MTPTRCRCCGGSGIEPEQINSAVLVRAVAVTFGELAFTTKRLRERAMCEDDAGLRAVLSGHSQKTIGRALKRIEGRTFDGVRLERVGHDTHSNASLWMCRVL